jgi:hypothetical protein
MLQYWGNSYTFRNVQAPLLLCDFGNSLSYPGTGTALTNLGTASVAGTLINGPTFSSANGGILILDGINDYVAFNDTASQLIPTGGLSVIAWARTGTNDKYLVDKQNGAAANAGYRLELNSGGAIAFGVMSTTITSPNGQANGAWMMLAGVWTPSVSLRLLRNLSVLATTTTNVPAIILPQSTPMRWGARANNADYWNGSISRLRIESRALSDAELTSEFNAYRSRYSL